MINRILCLKRNDGAKYFGLRLLLFFVIYSLVSIYYSSYTGSFLGYVFNNVDAYLSYLVFPLLLAFTYFKWKEIKKIKPYGNSLWQTILFAVIAVLIFNIPITTIVSIESGGGNNEISFPFIAYYIQLILAFISIFLAIFNLRFVKKFKLEIIILAFAIFLYIFAQILVERSWEKFSYLITYSLSYILPLFTKFTFVDLETFSVRMLDFSVYIGPTCAGIYSMITFLFLFVVTLVLVNKHKNIDAFKAAIALLLGIAAVFVLNILRVATIVLVGAYYSPILAIELFHEYLSAIFLIVLFALYLYFIIPRILEEKREIVEK
ncbi:hypothetical protein GF366_03175 [Candidatus Peregrinibacteria bacterium]|nr:hypothetical protein [Candidatus Peregrinibacteria bacterium]